MKQRRKRKKSEGRKRRGGCIIEWEFLEQEMHSLVGQVEKSAASIFRERDGVRVYAT